MITIRVTREYDVTVADLYPDGLPDRHALGARPSDWDDERWAAYLTNERFASNPFEPSSFAKDFADWGCAREHAYATVSA